jgi:hypothetical protein
MIAERFHLVRRHVQPNDFAGDLSNLRVEQATFGESGLTA